MDLLSAAATLIAFASILTALVIAEEWYDRWYRDRDQQIHDDLDFWGGY